MGRPDGAPQSERDSGPEGRRTPEGPTDLSAPSWRQVLVRTGREFRRDNLGDWAAALTYYGVLSLFPGLLVLVSVLGILGQDATGPLLDAVRPIAPGPVRDILTQGARGLPQSSGSVILATGAFLAALWSASGYVGAFMRAANAVYDVPEGRPLWKKLPVRLGITVVTGVLLVCCALAVVLTGRLAERVGEALGIGSAAVTAWDIAKWPVLALVVSAVFALLYWAAPNARQGFRWVSPGGLLALVLWLIASAGFAFYVAHFGSYNKTYGTLGGVIVFLVWLWISNIAILLGAEFDAELARGRAIEAGHRPDDEPFVELRDAPADGSVAAGGTGPDAG